VTDLTGERIVVTGGAGVIARELLELLSDGGAAVLSIDRLPLPSPAPPNVDHHEADLANADLGFVSAFRPSRILHLAATFERSVESAEFWAQNWSDNVVATHRLLNEVATVGDIGAFVFASSYLVYSPDQYLSPKPPGDERALGETAALMPRNLCGAAKLYAEAELAFAEETLRSGFRSVSARIFRVYGRGSRDVVSRWVRAALRDELVEIYHPENRFDYVYSRDVAEGLLRMAIEPRASGAINLATGTGRSVSDVIGAIEAVTGRRLRAQTVVADEPFEASRADVSRLQDILSWTPTTALQAGVARIVAHEENAQ
jgi:nucleoside-diphosphate-sugar epimerase